MADFFTNYSAGVPKSTSLADMINLASGIQNYQQAQQMNPLAAQKSLADVQSARQTAAKGEIDLSQAEQANRERLNIQQAIAMNPQKFQTNGRFDPDKLMQELPSLAPMTHTDYMDRYAKTMESTAKAEESVNKLSTERRSILAGVASALGYAGVQNPKSYELAFSEIKKLYKSDAAFNDAADSFADTFKNSTAGSHLPKVAILMGNTIMSPEQQRSAFAPKAVTQDVGNVIQEVVSKPSVLGEQPSIRPTGQTFGKGLAPQVFPNQITGAAQVIGGGQGSPAAPASQPVGQPAPQMNAPQNTAQAGSESQLAQLPNESPANFNARVAQTQSMYRQAVDEYSNPNSPTGHIPTAQNLNKNIMDLLKDKSVNTGAVSDYLANKTNKGSLNPKEQELAKYLQQRIENMGARTDQAANNLKNAYGSFNLDKEALKEIVRNDNIFLTTRDLLAKGVLHNGHNPMNPSNPKYGSVSNFTTQFAPYAANTTLMKYISLVGEGKKVHLDDEDKAALQNLVGKMSPEQRQKLEQLRQEALGLVNPGGR